ncbi:unnamed protein product [Rotaria magnacalcarata]
MQTQKSYRRYNSPQRKQKRIAFTRTVFYYYVTVYESDCIQHDINEIVVLIADIHTITKIKVRNKRFYGKLTFFYKIEKNGKQQSSNLTEKGGQKYSKVIACFLP